MRSITFENLRRLMGGGRKKKDRAEPSFKRSDSFKRISIKRNYLDRGGKSRVPLPPSKGGCNKTPTACSSPSRPSTPDAKATPTITAVPADAADPLVIGYGQWVRNAAGSPGGCHLKPKRPSCSSEDRPPTPPPRRRGSSIATDSSSLEIIKLERSPLMVRRRPCERDADGSRPDSAISVNLGRVWLDAPLAMAPRSLELPRPPQGAPYQSVAPPGARRAHHSLDSALKDKQREDTKCGRRFLTPRTLHASRDSSADLMCSSKDSGFSFSISIPRLGDVSPASLSPPPCLSPNQSSSYSGGFFRRKKKLSKPAPSVSRDGYFKRTSGACPTGPGPAPVEPGTQRNSLCRSSSRKKKAGSRASGRGSTRGSSSTRASGRRKKLPLDAAGTAALYSPPLPPKTGSVTGSVRSDLLYQVVVNRPPRSLSSLKLDPMIFVAPEKRKTNVTNSHKRLPHRYEVQEIRGTFLGREGHAHQSTPPDTEDEGLYECISGSVEEVDSVCSVIDGSVESLISPDPDEPDLEQPLDLSVQRVRVIQCTPAAQSTPKQPVPAAFPTPTRPSVTIKTKQNHVTRVMINMPSDHSSSDADTEDETYVPLGYSPVPRRRPVQRRKSARRNLKYLAKPCIHRAPSTLRRARKSEYGQRGPRSGPSMRLVAVKASADTDSEGEWI